MSFKIEKQKKDCALRSKWQKYWESPSSQGHNLQKQPQQFQFTNLLRAILQLNQCGHEGGPFPPSLLPPLPPFCKVEARVTELNHPIAAVDCQCGSQERWVPCHHKEPTSVPVQSVETGTHREAAKQEIWNIG